ncbi:MAG TPA: Maf family protein [Bacillota bacterium]|nr:septum formation inhibitor Maf [Bacillota bacterium]HOA15189.1 Maf family protein [Bacillota bacterium]HOG52751.1 Maf family protein [Bacillota bacterium]
MAGLILASASPRRVELLEALKIEFEVVPSNADETVEDGLSPGTLVEALARAKASAVSASRPKDLVLGADTVVAIGGQVLGKPKDCDDAARMLRMLQGRSHEVYTGICVKREADGFERVAHEVTEVRFLPMSEEEIASYVGTGEPLDKAGAYAIQGFGTLFISGITGDYFNVVGLPLRLVAEMLEEAGVKVI